MGLSDDLLAFDDLATKEVDVPVWKRKVTIREMGLQESLTAFGPDRVGEDGTITLGGLDIARVVACGVIDAKGERVFSDDDIPKLANKNRTPLMFLYNEITALSGSIKGAGKN